MEVPEVAEEELTAFQGLNKSYNILSRLVEDFEISNSDYLNDLLDELNNPIKGNLVARISSGEDYNTELIDTLTKLQKKEEVLHIEDQYFDVDQLQDDLLKVVSLVDSAKIKGSKRMDILFSSFQKLKNTQEAMITKSIAKYINDSGVLKLDGKIAETEALVAKLKTNIMEKKYIFNAKKADTNLSVEELRHKYELDIEEVIRNLISSIDRNKTELTSIELRQVKAVSSIEQMKSELSLLLREIDKEEKDSLVKDLNPIEFFYDINHALTNNKGGDDAVLITQQAVDESFKTLEAVTNENALLLERIAAADENVTVRRSELNSILKREDNKALERLKKMCGNLESKIESDKKRVAVLELIVKQMEKEKNSGISQEANKINRPTINRTKSNDNQYPTNQPPVTTKPAVPAPAPVVPVPKPTGFVETNNRQLNGLLNSVGGVQSESTAAAVHRSLYSRYNVKSKPQAAAVIVSEQSRQFNGPHNGAANSGNNGNQPPQFNNQQQQAFSQNQPYTSNAMPFAPQTNNINNTNNNNTTGATTYAPVFTAHSTPVAALHPQVNRFTFDSADIARAPDHLFNADIGAAATDSINYVAVDMPVQSPETFNSSEIENQEKRGTDYSEPSSNRNRVTASFLLQSPQQTNNRQSINYNSNNNNTSSVNNNNSSNILFNDSKDSRDNNMSRGATNLQAGSPLTSSQSNRPFSTTNQNNNLNNGNSSNYVQYNSDVIPHYMHPQSPSQLSPSRLQSAQNAANNNNNSVYSSVPTTPLYQQQLQHGSQQIQNAQNLLLSPQYMQPIQQVNYNPVDAKQRVIPPHQLSKVQHIIDMFDHEKSRLFSTNTNSIGEYLTYNPVITNNSLQLLQYSMILPVVSAEEKENLIDSMANEMLMIEHNTTPLNRKTLSLHNKTNHNNSNNQSNAHSPLKAGRDISPSKQNHSAASTIAKTMRSFTLRRKQGVAGGTGLLPGRLNDISSGANDNNELLNNSGQQSMVPSADTLGSEEGNNNPENVNNNSNINNNEDNIIYNSSLHHREHTYRPSVRRKQALQLSRNSFTSDNYFKSSIMSSRSGSGGDFGVSVTGLGGNSGANNSNNSNGGDVRPNTTGKNNTTTNNTVPTDVTSTNTLANALTSKQLSPPSRQNSIYRYFDANKTVYDGQEEEASDFYLQTFGYKTAVEQLNTLLNILTNYNSNHVSATDGQIMFSKTAEQELETVELLRAQITSCIQKIKHAYHESTHVQAILKEIQSESNRCMREIDVARSNLLVSIEGVKWPLYLKPGEYQQEIEACKSRIRTLRTEARAWESKVNKKRKANMRLSMLITTDQSHKTGPAAGRHPATMKEQRDKAPVAGTSSSTNSNSNSNVVDKMAPISETNGTSGSSNTNNNSNNGGSRKISPTNKDKTSAKSTSKNETNTTDNNKNSTIAVVINSSSAGKNKKNTLIKADTKASFSAKDEENSENNSLFSSDSTSTLDTLTSALNNITLPPTNAKPKLIAPGPARNVSNKHANNPQLIRVSAQFSNTNSSGPRSKTPSSTQKSFDAGFQVPVSEAFERVMSASRPAGHYSVANNRLAIFNDITDIYAQTLSGIKSSFSVGNTTTDQDIAAAMAAAAAATAAVEDTSEVSVSGEKEELAELAPSDAFSAVDNRADSKAAFSTLHVDTTEQSDGEEEESDGLLGAEGGLISFVPSELKELFEKSQDDQQLSAV